MTIRAQPYRLQWPVTPDQWEGVDTMFETLFKAINNGSIDVTPAQINGIFGVPQGGTGINTYAVGDLLYASAVQALSKLPDAATGNALISGGIGVAPGYGKIGLSTHVSGTLPIANGGTGQVTALAAFDALSPMSARGDLITRDASTNIRLALGNVGTLLRSNGTDALWSFVMLSTDVNGTLPILNGGTGQTTKQAAFDGLSPLTTAGDIIYSSGANNNRLAKGTDGQFLTSGSLPAWANAPAFVAIFGANGAAGLNPVDSTTYYWGSFYSFVPGTTDGPVGVEIGRDCKLVAVYLRVTVLGTLASGESTTVTVRKNTAGGAGTDILTVTAALLMSSAVNLVTKLGQSIACTAGDTLYLKMVTPAWVTNPTAVLFNATLYFEVP